MKTFISLINNGKTKRIILLILALFLLAGLFYWFELRPNTIRKNCEFMIFSKQRAIYSGYGAVLQNNEFRQCLVRNGLAPESLYVNTQ
jgi:hypothetical protein